MGFASTALQRWCVCACGFGLACSGIASEAAAHAAPAAGKSRAGVAQRHAVEISPWEQAERARDALEAEPESRRTKVDYTRVMDGFRAIYHDAPQDMHAAEAVNAVAELLSEQGRGMHDTKLLKAAIGQYEFLRTQYPGSSLRVGALLAQGQIEENDLHDAAAAKERYELLLKLHPRSALAEEARAGVASVDALKSERLRGQSGKSEPVAVSSGKDLRGSGPAEYQRGLYPIISDGKAVGEGGASGVDGAAGQNPASRTVGGGTPTHRGETAINGAPTSVAATSDTATPVARTVVRRTGPPAAVTGIRHWSTPSYTRVAIDLGGEVEYEAARVPGPDRIYFDLHGARLAQDLVGKSFAVTDDGFLKKIRVAQSSGDVARVVLDVNDVTEYSAFLLPNPYRLIIDIHGGAKLATAPLASVDAPAKPAVTVPNTRAVNGGSGADVARLSDQPGKVEATSVPTSQPISAVVPGRSREQTGNREQLADGRVVPAESSTLAAGRVVAANGHASSPNGDPGSVESRSQAGMTYPLTFAARRGRKGRATTTDAKVVGDPAMPARAAVPTADGQTSLVRALGLKIGRIVIDAGHGGHDSGTIGADGIEEKDVVLDVALRVGKLLHERLGAEVIYTRSDDTFIPLETRTAIANKAQADLFLSIHANSSADASARGVETYYLNFTQQADALAVAARENAVSNQSIYQLSDLVKKIALKDKIAESREFATDVEASLYSGLARGNEGLKNRGVKKAPFVVLIGANMPSILAEISFVTNPKDANQLQQPEYRERVAESLYKGVARYAGGLSGTRPATVAVAQRSGGQ